MNIEEKYSQNSQEFAYLGLMEEMRMEALLLALLQEGDSALEERAMEYGDKIIQLKDEIRDTEMLLERLRRLLADYGKSDNILQEIAAGQRLELTEGMDVLIDGKKISMTPCPRPCSCSSGGIPKAFASRICPTTGRNWWNSTEGPAAAMTRSASAAPSTGS